MCWTISFLRTKLDSTSVGRLIVKTAEFGVLKTHVHCVKIPFIRQRWLFDMQCPEKGVVGLQLTEEEITAENWPIFLTHFIVVVSKNEGNCWFQQCAETARSAKTKLSCRTSVIV